MSDYTKLDMTINSLSSWFIRTGRSLFTVVFDSLRRHYICYLPLHGPRKRKLQYTSVLSFYIGVLTLYDTPTDPTASVDSVTQHIKTRWKSFSFRYLMQFMFTIQAPAALESLSFNLLLKRYEGKRYKVQTCTSSAWFMNNPRVLEYLAATMSNWIFHQKYPEMKRSYSLFQNICTTYQCNV